MDLESGGVSCRWAVNASQWMPSSSLFARIVSLLPSSEQTAVLSYVKMEDKKRALVSRLLQRVLIHSILNVPYDEIVIARTPQGKPYLENLSREQKIAKFNFNVSHHGNYVVIVSEPNCLVGVDVVACESSQTESPLEYFDNFRSYFTKLEWDTICSSDLHDLQKYQQFYRFWCMKESYVKAVGVGLSFGLERLEFYYPSDDSWGNIAYVRIDGKEARDWTFFLHNLPEEHWVCVAKGPISDTSEAYKTLVANVLHPSGSQHDRSFTLLTLSDVVSKMSTIVS